MKTTIDAMNPDAPTFRRDPFARGELRRYPVRTHGQASCAWCGRDNGRLFAYVWESDDAPQRSYPTSRHAFCGLGCHDSFGES